MTPEQLGEVIRKARGKRSQRSVAKAAGISRHQLVAIERAGTNYTRMTLFALAKEVGVDIKAIPK
jgi:transcriptional regulator with XRE-family HTH domain